MNKMDLKKLLSSASMKNSLLSLSAVLLFLATNYIDGKRQEDYIRELIRDELNSEDEDGRNDN